MNYLIIGGGIAGTTTAEELRKIDANATITILSNEKHPLYSRVILPQYILGRVARERVFLKPENWYLDHKIELVFDDVTGVYPNNKLVTTQKDSYEYDKLLIAGGGVINHMDFPGHADILHFQTIEHADAILKLVNELDKKDTKPRVGVIGGSLISMEFVNIFGAHEYETHIFLRKDRFFSQSYDVESSAVLEKHLATKNIIVHKNVEVSSFIDGVAKLTDGSTIELDALTAGVGLSSSFDWAKKSGIEVNKGIVCNEFLETNIEDIFTAGDCAEYFDTITGQNVRLGNWMNAIMQARAVAKTMSGKRTGYELVSSSAIKVLGMDVIVIGFADANNVDEIHDDVTSEGKVRLFGKGGKLVGASLINRTHERARLTTAIKERVPITTLI